MSARLTRPEEGNRLRSYRDETSPDGFPEYLPPVSRDLIEYLEKKFPNVLPPEGTTLEELHLLQGEQRLIEHLRLVLDRIENDNH